MRNRFERQLQKLHDDLVEMGAFIETTIDKTMSAFRTNNYEFAREVYENDDIADELEAKIERRSLRILLFQQPVARDLRIISAAFKMITDMERICDLAKNIAETVLSFEGKEFIKKPDSILQMSDKCVIMVNKAIEAFIKSDLELAKMVISMDNEVDELYWEIRRSLEQFAAETQNPSSVMQAMDFVMVSKHLERMADHGVNIAEWVVFSITGHHKDKVLL
ncbi:MAG: phosphate signaling complex protein PhoU [Chitinispirillales bacterium]|jgi:phosphate transport system protein|nr:phosphate signaling complex protein PhoU [Chitinispirillales bacterium]